VDGGVVARRAVIRWAMRLFRREWRQQILVLSLLTAAVAVMVVGTAVATATPGHPAEATFGSATAMVSLPGGSPRLAADIAEIKAGYGAVSVIEDQDLVTGTIQTVTLRAEDPNASFGSPRLSLVSGRYPHAPGQVAVTSSVASLYGVRVGGEARLAGRSWTVTGIVENPSNLLDEFALVEPGQVTAPTQVTILFDAPHGSVTALPVSYPSSHNDGVSPAVIALVASVLGLVFIGLVAVAGFSVMAQRRLRSLGMLSSLGATEGNVRLVMVASGFVVGVAGVTIGAVIGFGAWFAYVPRLRNATGHAIDPLALPWPTLAAGMALAIVTATLAARSPARTVARVPVVAALSGRPPRPRAVHRSAAAGLITLAAGLTALVFSGGWGSSGGPQTLFLLGGLIATTAGMCLLAGICVVALAGFAGPRAPVAVRIALRDLVRYRARSGSALGAVSFAVFLAMLITLIASFRFALVLDWTGENLTSSQFIVYARAAAAGPGSGAGQPLTAAQTAALGAEVNTLSAGLRATSVLPLYVAQTTDPNSFRGTATLAQLGTQNNNFSGTLYVATPALLAAYGVRADTGADIITMRPGLATEPRMRLLSCFPGPGSTYNCPVSSYIDDPVIQTAGSLPSGTSAPNTAITMRAVRALHLRTELHGWLVGTPRPLTAAQIDSLRTAVAADGGTLETKSGELGLTQITSGATTAGILVALGVLAMSVGLIRSETSGDLRTLAATGASARTRRTITAATAGGLALTGAVLGSAVAFVAVVAWARGSLGATFAHVPWTDVWVILVGLPVTASLGGWLLAGRQPPVISRQPLE
jgi:putative ABC transport system permease protein